MRVAVHHGVTVGVEAALADLERRAAAAARAGADLLVLPQLFLGGRPADAPRARRQAGLSDGPAARRVGGIAREHGVALLCGYVEGCTGHCYDAALFVDPRGRALANYRRVHLAPETEGGMFAPGQWLTLVPFAGRRLGVLVGIDLDGPEQARALALAGAGVLLVAGGHGPEAAAVGAVVARARAVENGCALAFANGDPRPGAPPSCLVGPDGAVLASSPPGAADGLAVADLPPAAADRALARDLGRRPRLYQRLVAPLPGEDAPRL